MNNTIYAFCDASTMRIDDKLKNKNKKQRHVSCLAFQYNITPFNKTKTFEIINTRSSSKAEYLAIVKAIESINETFKSKRNVEVYTDQIDLVKIANCPDLLEKKKSNPTYNRARQISKLIDDSRHDIEFKFVKGHIPKKYQKAIHALHSEVDSYAKKNCRNVKKKMKINEKKSKF